ncbi:PTS ascorbate transporter subunit IIC [Clostridium psychrophilum]|uniref:PTS ascorbate transporter subunit IIC n=1 Tax=Clostridium psychrophilum TaxID=132926 RepID=UPI001C0C35B8|nr:PTS ascorbate transporter subunit IIC [Clostridium psychrophilum]MBU3181688.1 PTS ascorbate transporter subunit IIC [Clostridium psychrophilum]
MKFIISFFSEPAIIVGLMALIGLIALKKPISKIVTGTFKTIIGFVIFQIGSTAIADSLGVLGTAFQSAFNMQGVVPTNEAIIALVQKNFGMEMALIMAFGFIVNLVIARFTSLKYVFLTGHHMLFMAGLLAAILTAIGFSGVELIIVGSLLLGATMVITPALVQPYYRKVTGGDSVAMGHFNAVTYVIAAEVSKRFGNKEQSTEDIKVPEGISFFKDNVISTALVMLVLFIVTIQLADNTVAAKLATGGNITVFSIMSAMKFTAGFVIVLQGVRMMLAEIIPAFKGISEKIVPNAIPALDCPVIFPFAPNAVIIGFLSSLAGAVAVFAILPFTGLAIMLPGLIPAFFVGAAAGVLANAQGGLRGTIIGCFVNGAILNLLPAFLLPLLGNLGYANSTFGDSDFSFYGIIVGQAGKVFAKVGVYGLLVVILLVFVGLTIRSNSKNAKDSKKVNA